MDFPLVALDKWLRVCPVGIRDTLWWSLTKPVMRAVGNQAKTSCGNIQLCTSIKVGIERAKHAIGQRWRERSETGEEEEKWGEE